MDSKKNLKRFASVGAIVAGVCAPIVSAFAAIPNMSGGTLGSSAPAAVVAGASNVVQSTGASAGAGIPLYFVYIGLFLICALFIWLVMWPFKGAKRLVRH